MIIRQGYSLDTSVEMAMPVLRFTLGMLVLSFMIVSFLGFTTFQDSLDLFTIRINAISRND